MAGAHPRRPEDFHSHCAAVRRRTDQPRVVLGEAEGGEAEYLAVTRRYPPVRRYRLPTAPEQRHGAQIRLSLAVPGRLVTALRYRRGNLVRTCMMPVIFDSRQQGMTDMDNVEKWDRYLWYGTSTCLLPLKILPLGGAGAWSWWTSAAWW